MHGQLVDDLELFESMRSDYEDVEQIYRPGNYWQKYYDETVRVILSDGLKDFRRQPWGYFRSFGAADYTLNSEYQLLYLERSGASATDQRIARDFLNLAHERRSEPILPYSLSYDDLDHMAARTAEIEGKMCGAKPLLAVRPDLVGDYLHTFEYKGVTYSHFFLQYYMRYAYVARFIDFGQIDNIVEIGSGAGNQVEVLKKLYPHLNFYLLDMPPYLYVCHQFLHYLFPEDCVDFRETTRGPIQARDGQIVFLGNWRIGDINPKGRTLFWNSASFGEMEPDIVEHYMRSAREWSSAVYLYQCMGGKEKGEAGKGGVLQQTTMDHYVKNLGEDFRLVDVSPAYKPLQLQQASGGYDDALWLREN